MFDLEIPELSFSSASSGFSEQNQEKDEDAFGWCWDSYHWLYNTDSD